MTATPPRVRPATSADAVACAAIYRPSVEGSAVSFESLAPSPEEMAARISAAHRWLVAEAEDEVLGYAYAAPWRSRDAYGRTCEVSVYVAADRGGRGIGTLLYGALLPVLARDGFHQAVAGMTLPNPGSVRLHESVGFRHVGVFSEVGWKGGRWHDVGWMQLALADVGR